MEDILKNMDKEKRDRIINSALKEFSQNSFEKASTNAIVKDARISKGLLFHYFKNKQNLYDTLEEYVIGLISKGILEKIDWTESDLIERIKQIILIKIKIMNQYPYVYDFSLSMLKNASVAQLKGRYDTEFADLMIRVYKENIDYSLFKDDIDIQKGVHIIQWTLEKISEAAIEKSKLDGEHIDLDQIYHTVEEYLKVLKKAFYKNSNNKGGNI